MCLAILLCELLFTKCKTNGIIKLKLNNKQKGAIKMLKGLSCGILEDKSIGNCSAGGISSRCKEVTLIGIPGEIEIEGVFEATEERPAVRIVKRFLFGRNYYHAEPIDDDGKNHWYSSGGTFIYTSDSRFPFDYPLPLHDRKEW